MRVILLFCLFFILGKFCLGQQWTNLGNTGIKSAVFKDDWGESVYFKKGSTIIAKPVSSSNDFSTLFLQNAGSLKLLSDSCLPVYSIILGDSAVALFKKHKVDKVILIEYCGVTKANRERELWNLKIKHGQLQPCWQTMSIERTLINSTKRLKLLSFMKQACEI